MKKILDFLHDILMLLLTVVLTVAFIPVLIVMLPFLLQHNDDGSNDK